jgi:hypothetical protein
MVYETQRQSNFFSWMCLYHLTDAPLDLQELTTSAASTYLALHQPILEVSLKKPLCADMACDHRS